MTRLLCILFLVACTYAHGAYGTAQSDAVAPQKLTQAYPLYNQYSTYLAETYITGSDRNVYRSLGVVKGVDPVSDLGERWQMAFVNVDTTLNIPSRFPTFEAAWSFIQNATIESGRMVTLKFAEGIYNFGAKRFVINHPQGSQITIIGDIAARDKVVLNFSGPPIAFRGYIQNDWAFWAVNSGHRIGLIDGFTINGPGMTSPNAYGAIAISAFEGSSVTVGPHVAVNDAYAGVAAFFNSTIWADGITVTGGGDGNIWAYAGSTISCNRCISTGANTFYSKSGVLADNFSYIFAPNLKTSGNACGVSLWTGSSAKLDSAALDEGLCYSGMNTTEGYDGKAGPTRNGVVADPQHWNWNGLVNNSKEGYGPFDFSWTGSSAVGGVGANNNVGNDIHCFLGGSTQIVRTVFGLTGNIGDCSTNGASQFAILTYDAKPLKFGTNNTQGMQIDQNDQTAYTVLGKKWGGTHGANGTMGVVILSGGTVKVSTSAIAALAGPGDPGDAIYLSLQNCVSCGTLSVGTVVAGTSFVINSTNPLDGSKVLWEIKRIY